jgi:hypothetical protein
MPSPNINVLKALFESYLNIRMRHWGSSPPSSKTDNVKACLQEIEILNDKLDENSLRNLVNKFIILAQAELKEAQNTRSGVLYFIGISGRFIDRPLLLETIVSAISYIASEENAVNLAEYDKILTELKKLNTYPKNMIDLHEVFFNEVIKIRDPEALNLKEKSFADYVNNVNDGKRKFDSADKLLGPNKPSTPKHSSTSLINTFMDVPSPPRTATPDVSIAISSARTPHFTFTTTQQPPKPPIIYAGQPKVYLTRNQRKKQQQALRAEKQATEREENKYRM